MSTLIYLAAAAQILFGCLAFVAGRNAMNETTAAVAIGFGVVCLCLGRLLQYREAEELRRETAERKADWEARKIV